MAKKTKKIKTSNVVLMVVSITLVIFTIYMCYLFRQYGSVPDTLVTCVFSVCGTEFGVLAWIRTAKEKYKEREWQKEDEKKAKRRN